MKGVVDKGIGWRHWFLKLEMEIREKQASVYG